MRSPAAREKRRLADAPGFATRRAAGAALQPSHSPVKKSKPPCAKSEAGDDLLSLAVRHRAPSSLCTWPWMQ